MLLSATDMTVISAPGNPLPSSIQYCAAAAYLPSTEKPRNSAEAKEAAEYLSSYRVRAR